LKNRTFQNLQEFQNRRNEFAKRAPNSALILFSGSESGWERFRSASDFVYMTGFEEPESICVFLPGQKNPYRLFVRPRDPAKEIWDGFRYGLEGAKSVFGADESYDIHEFSKLLPSLLAGVETVYYQLESSEKDWVVLRAIKEFITTLGRSGRGMLPIHDPKEVIGEMRNKKSPQEQDWHREACRLSAESHRELMKKVRAGMNEKEIQAILFDQFYSRGAHREGYFSIIAAGANATILHYRDNNSPSKDGDLLLVDAGAEKNYFTADITRTYPLNGKFSKAQRDVYARVLKVQKNLIAMVKPGIRYEEIQESARKQLTQELIEMGFLKGTVDQNIHSLAYRKYYPHNIGHFLGMDVHDVGLYKVNGQSRLLEEGMVITIEPGIYVPADDDTVPKEYRGIGIRIEDDILVTASGHEVMTSLAPKEIDEIEAVMAKGGLT
jgi:Xaa-Pro aminopeptidase